MRISYSALEVFENCPKRYEYQVIEKIKAPKSKEQVFGTCLHSALKYLFLKAPIFPTLDQLIEYFMISWEEASSKIKLITPQEKEILTTEAKRILTNFYNKNIPNFSSTIVALETRFETQIEDPKKEGLSHTLAGIIDRIDKIDEKQFEIVDYKTNRRMPSFSSSSQNFQLSIYALGFFSKWPDLTDLSGLKLSLYFLKHNEKMTNRIKSEDLEALKNRILKNIEEIEKGYFPPVPSPLCNFCSYRNICPMWSHLYTDLDIPEEKEAKKMIDEYFEIKTKSEESTQKLAKIKKEINKYLEKNNLERVFGDSGFITQTIQTKEDYDLDMIEKIMRDNNLDILWKKIVGPDKKKFESLLKSLPNDVIKLLEPAKKKPKTTKTTRAFKKSIAKIKQDLN